VRFDLTPDEADLIARLLGACDDMDAEGDVETKSTALQLERYFRRRLAAPKLETCATRPGCPARGCDECGHARPPCKK
jgi:hypothetical protein